MLRRLENGASVVSRAIAVAGLLLLLVFAAATLADGLTRWLFSRPIDLVRDIGGLLAAVVVSCCFPIAFLERSNIRIRLIGKLSRRLGHVLDAGAAVIVGSMLALIAAQIFRHAGHFVRAGDKTWVFDVPIAPFWYAVSLVVWLAVAVQLLVIALEFGRFLCRGEQSKPLKDRL